MLEEELLDLILEHMVMIPENAWLIAECATLLQIIFDLIDLLLDQIEHETNEDMSDFEGFSDSDAYDSGYDS